MGISIHMLHATISAHLMPCKNHHHLGFDSPACILLLHQERKKFIAWHQSPCSFIWSFQKHCGCRALNTHTHTHPCLSKLKVGHQIEKRNSWGITAGHLWLPIGCAFRERRQDKRRFSSFSSHFSFSFTKQQTSSLQKSLPPPPCLLLPNSCSGELHICFQPWFRWQIPTLLLFKRDQFLIQCCYL